MKLKDGQVELRGLTLEDAYTSVNWRNNPKVWAQTVNAPNKIITLEDEINWITRVIQEDDSKRFAILYDDIYVGNIQLTNITKEESYYGIFIGNTDYWGLGIGSRAVPLILKVAFEVLGLKKVKIRIRINHTVIYKIHDRLGFKETSRDDELIYMELLNNQYQINAGGS